MLRFGDSFIFRSGSVFNSEYYTNGFADLAPNGRGGDTAANGAAFYNLGADYNQLTIGMGWTANYGQSPFTFANSAGGAAFSCSINLDTDGRWNFTANNTSVGVPSASSVRSVRQGLWYFVELNVITTPIHLPALPPIALPPVGRADQWYVQCDFIFRVNGVEWLSGRVNSGGEQSATGAGADGQNWWPPSLTQTGHLSMSEFRAVAAGAGLMNDLYVTDGEFLGDCTYTNLYPASDVSVSMTPSTGSSNFACVNTHPADNTKYVTASSPLSDTYSFDPLPAFNGDVLGTVLAMRVLKTDGGSAQIKEHYTSGMTTVDSVNKWRPGGGYTWRYKIDVLDKSPFTGLRWTQTEINALEAGPDRLS